MSDDMYDDDNLDVVQPNEIGLSPRSLMAPDAVALGGLTHHHGADYGLPDTTVTVVDGYQAVHDGVVYEGGETVVVPSSVAQYWVRSGWATTESEATASNVTVADFEPMPPVDAPAKAASRTSAPVKRQTTAGTGRRKG